MPELNVNIPPFKAWVRKEFLHDQKSGQGEFEHCLVFAVRSVPSRAIGFRILLDSGAQYEGVPVHAFVWNKDDFVEEWPIYLAEMWDCFGLNVVCNVYEALSNLSCSVYLRDSRWADGTYMFSLDWHSNVWSDLPEERKDAHIIKLETGVYCAYPNNRICWKEGSFTDPFVRRWTKEKPTYRANTTLYSCEDSIPDELKFPVSTNADDLEAFEDQKD